MVSECLSTGQGEEITYGAGATRVRPGNADLKAQRPRGRHIVGDHAANVSPLGSHCTQTTGPALSTIRDRPPVASMTSPAKLSRPAESAPNSLPTGPAIISLRLRHSSMQSCCCRDISRLEIYLRRTAEPSSGYRPAHRAKSIGLSGSTGHTGRRTALHHHAIVTALTLLCIRYRIGFDYVRYDEYRKGEPSMRRAFLMSCVLAGLGGCIHAETTPPPSPTSTTVVAPAPANSTVIRTP